MAANDVEILKEYIKDETVHLNNNSVQSSVKISSLTNFLSVQEIWQWTNEPLGSYYDKDCVNKSVLTVTSGGDHILHSALAGATNITSFDINLFSKYIASLKVAMIKKYDFYDFRIKSLILTTYEFHKVNLILQDISSLLSSKEQEFWTALVKAYEECDSAYEKNNISLKLLTNGKVDIDGLDYYNPRKYDQLQSNIGNCKISYMDCALEEIDEKLADKYDLVYLSNILGRSKKFNENLFILNSLGNHLNINGTIYDYVMMNRYGWHRQGELDMEAMKLQMPDFNIEITPCNGGEVYKYIKK